MKRYTYYPGCSLKGQAIAYEKSTLATFKALGAELTELPDWNCCGATFYFAIDSLGSYGIAARNLVLAEEFGNDLLLPCAACYLVMKKTEDKFKNSPETAEKISRSLREAGLNYKGFAKPRHPLEILVNDFGYDEIASKAKVDLSPYKIACYYGCQVVRPFSDFDDPHLPVTMDNLFKALGADVVPYHLKARCCGMSLTGTIENVGLRLVYILLKEAKRFNVDAIVTLCPLCQFNLEVYQDKIKKDFGEDVTMPVIYFTQLLGLALGLSEKELGFNHQIVPFKIKKETVKV